MKQVAKRSIRRERHRRLTNGAYDKCRNCGRGLRPSVRGLFCGVACNREYLGLPPIAALTEPSAVEVRG
jgi:hypothetical protein